MVLLLLGVGVGSGSGEGEGFIIGVVVVVVVTFGVISSISLTPFIIGGDDNGESCILLLL